MSNHKGAPAFWIRFLFCLVEVIWIFSSIHQTQEGKLKDPSSYQLKIPVDLVIVPVTVRDADGILITGLEKSDFLLEEDGIQQPLSYFSIDPLPLTVAILVDRSLDDRTQELLQRHLRAILGGLSQFDEAALFDFFGVRHKIQDFTMDRESIAKAASGIRFMPGYVMPFMNKPEVIPGGSSRTRNMQTVDGLPREILEIKITNHAPKSPDLDSAINSVAHDLHRREKWRRKVIFAVSSGRTSLADSTIIPETLQYLSNEGILVCGISSGGTLLFRHFDPLKRYATATGGAVYLPVLDQAFPDTFQKLLVEAKNQYVLGFKPPEGGRNGFRKITVMNVNPRCQGGEIYYRHGYYDNRGLANAHPNDEQTK